MGLSQADIEKAKDDLLAESSRDRTSVNRFVGKTDSVEDTLKLQTMGLQKLEDFTAKKRALEEQRQREAAQTAELEKEERKKLKKNLKKGKKAKLSFADDDEEEVKGELTLLRYVWVYTDRMLRRKTEQTSQVGQESCCRYHLFARSRT